MLSHIDRESEHYATVVICEVGSLILERHVFPAPVSDSKVADFIWLANKVPLTEVKQVERLFIHKRKAPDQMKADIEREGKLITITEKPTVTEPYPDQLG